jgi:uncharacterized protein (TIGR01777 family)
MYLQLMAKNRGECPMKFIIFGASGFIGSALTDYWLRAGHEVILVGRKAAVTPQFPHASSTTWAELEANLELAEGSDGWVNLSGASLNQRWSQKNKDLIIQSRLKAVNDVGRLLQRLHSRPNVIIQASAVGIYGTSLDKTFDENSPANISDFPSQVVQLWEAAADEAYSKIGSRVIKLRTGIVLGNGGGALTLLKLPYLLGFGGRMGSGKQWMSWIMLSDIIKLIDYAVHQSSIEGPLNAVAPHPVTNDKFGRMLGTAYHRPHWFPVPAPVLNLALGEMSELVLQGQRVLPAKALEHGFVFQYPELLSGLKSLKSKKSD